MLLANIVGFTFKSEKNPNQTPLPEKQVDQILYMNVCL